MWHYSSCGRIELNITKAQARTVTNPGPNDAEVLALSHVPSIRRQLAKIDAIILRKELRAYGAWDSVELQDHKQNLQRYLWVACWDISEGRS